LLQAIEHAEVLDRSKVKRSIIRQSHGIEFSSRDRSDEARAKRSKKRQATKAQKKTDNGRGFMDPGKASQIAAAIPPTTPTKNQKRINTSPRKTPSKRPCVKTMSSNMEVACIEANTPFIRYTDNGLYYLASIERVDFQFRLTWWMDGTIEIINDLIDVITVVGLPEGIVGNLDDGKQDLDSYTFPQMETLERNSHVPVVFLKKDGTAGRGRLVPLNNVCFGPESAQRILSLSDDAFRI
jgi:hypothetical protein